MTTPRTLMRGSRRLGAIDGLPAKTESCLCLPPFAQWAAVSTLFGAISEPVQSSRRFSSSATVNCHPVALALPPPTIRGVAGPAPRAAEHAIARTARKQTATPSRFTSHHGRERPLVPPESPEPLLEELERGPPLVLRGDQLRVAQLGPGESGRVPELARRPLRLPGPDVQIRLVMVVVPRRGPEVGPLATPRIAELHRDVEMLGPDQDPGGVRIGFVGA